MKIFILILLFSWQTHAWGKRGHSIVCQTAASLLHERSEMMMLHSFDLGYYCNVPDLIWKKPATYATEFPQHFMDLEIFDREFVKAKSSSDPLALSRAEFEKAFPQIPLSAGRSYWRIRELMDSLGEISKSLRASGKADGPLRMDQQAKWLITAGAIGHYVGDLSQPLHVTEDYDGQFSNAKGIHSWFEEALVDELSNTTHPGRLEAEVGELATKRWKKPKLDQLSVLDVLKAEAAESNKLKSDLMKIDKRVGRKNRAKAAEAFAPMIRERLAAGAVYLAALWSRELNWPYHGEKFFNFSGTPEYLQPAPGFLPPSANGPKVDPTPAP